jgi:hypothetical protein
VVTVLKAGRAAGTKALRLSGEAMLLRIARENIVEMNEGGEERGEGCGAEGVDEGRCWGQQNFGVLSSDSSGQAFRDWGKVSTTQCTAGIAKPLGASRFFHVAFMPAYLRRLTRNGKRLNRPCGGSILTSALLI